MNRNTGNNANVGAEQRVRNRSKGVTTLRNLRTFNSFKNRIYRLYYCGMLGQMASMNMQGVANGLLLERMTGSPAIVAAMSLANAIPQVSLSLLGGVIADRVEKKFVLLFGQVAFAATSLGVALALTLGYLSPERAGSWWIIVVSSALQGSVMGLAMPSRQAIINDIVSGEELMNAISLNFMGMNALQLLAPAAAGFLVQAFDFKAVYYTMTGLFLMAVFFFVLMPRVGIKSVSRGNALDQIKEGFTYVWHERTIRLVLFTALIAVILSSSYGVLMPFFADDVLKVGASGMGILLSVSGAGAITASLTLASLPNKKRGIMMLVGGVFLGVTLTGFAFSTLWPLSLGLIALVGITGTIRGTLANTLTQYYVDDNYRGRVMSLIIMQFGLSSLGTFSAGEIAQSFGVQWGVGGFAMLLVALSILAIIVFPRLRNLN